MSYKGFRQPDDPGVRIGPDDVLVDGDWLEQEFDTLRADRTDLMAQRRERDEQIAALQAQLDAIRELRAKGYKAAGTWGILLDELLASAPSDALDRVKREAAAQGRYEGFEEAVKRSRYSYETPRWWENPYADSAGAIRREATK